MLEYDLKQLIKKHKLSELATEPTDRYYDHITFSVGSLSDFITLVEAFAELPQLQVSQNLLYRGMADSRWKLLPSLMRIIEEKPKWYAPEHDLAVEFKSDIPTLFQNTHSNFEIIAKMQHFGIPTRLLDFTLNPLIALYFACSEHPRTPGRVVFTVNQFHYFDDPCVECTSSLYLIKNCNNLVLDKFVQPYHISVSDYLFDLFAEIHTHTPLFVKPPYLDDRMRVQRSIFLLFHNYVRDGLADGFYYNYKEVAPEIFRHETLEDIYKEQIEQPIFRLQDSPFFILNKCTFDRLVNSYRKLEIGTFSATFDLACEGRFYLQDKISPLEMPDIWWDFSSIIIPSKSKKTILKQLKHIGIDEAYVYPEAEHIAKRIRQQI
ncbi:MAG: FRG domain-containing protein [Clostridia bacterium]|nr:FRG domain-containing protein [Clostridia bacterium]